MHSFWRRSILRLNILRCLYNLYTLPQNGSPSYNHNRPKTPSYLLTSKRPAQQNLKAMAPLLNYLLLSDDVGFSFLFCTTVKRVPHEIRDT